jgi:two-component system NtrC family sensor kinase
MRPRRDAAVRLLKTMMAASIVLPVGLFSYASWVTYQDAYAHADEQLLARLDTMVEQANRIFQSVNLTFTSVDAIVDGMNDEEIKESEKDLHTKLSKLEKATAAVDAILIADRTGHTLVSSAVYPMRADLGVADRDYCLAQKESDAGTFVGSLLQPRVRAGIFFGISRRRPLANGQFTGIVALAVNPKVFNDFYLQLTQEMKGAGFSLARRDVEPSILTG